MRIDVDAVLRSRLGKRGRWVPRWLTRWLERVVCQDELNGLLESNAGVTGGEFCRGVLADLDVKAEFLGEDNLPAGDSRIVVVSNHPLGGLDGMIYIDYFTRRYAPLKPKFVVNDLLMAVRPLNDVFLPVNKHGSQSRERIRNIDEAFAGDAPVIVFPAGLCSRRSGFGKQVRDLEWHKMFVKKSIEYNRTVIPAYFKGENSSFFYNFAHLRRCSGLKFNVEMIYLPREVVRSRGKRFTVTFGRPVDSDSLRSADPEAVASRIKETVYGLANTNI